MLKCENELSVQRAEGKPVWKEERMLSWAWKSQKFDDLGYGKEFYIFISVQPLSRVWFFLTPWTTAHQASLSSPSSRACSNSCPSSWWCHATISSCHPLLLLPSIFPSIRVFFIVCQLFASGGQSIGVSASASVLPMNIQDWFPLGLTGWISLKSMSLKSLLPTTVQNINSLVLVFLYIVQLAHLYMTTGKTIFLSFLTVVGRMDCRD